MIEKIQIDMGDPDMWIDLELYGSVCDDIWVDDSLLEDILETAMGFFGL